MREGNTAVHMAIDSGNLELFNYVLVMLKVRDHIKGRFNRSDTVLEFRNRQDNTPLLFAAKRNAQELFEILVRMGANIYTQCNKLMNCLHYAVLNENKALVEQLVFADAEAGRLVSEKNFRNETPANLDDKNKFEGVFHHIWEAASIPSALERLD